MLKTKTEKYAPLNMSADSTAYFSDAAIKPYIAHRTTDKIETIIDPGPTMSLPEAKIRILSALAACDPALHESAKKILDDEKRLNIHLSDSPVMMQCRPAGLTMEDAMDFNNPELKKKFPTINNEKDYAIIDFEYDGTTRNVIYLAHELGHAIADDLQNQNGYDYKTNPTHMSELQAYLVQNIVAQHLSNDPNPKIAKAASESIKYDMAIAEYDLAISVIAFEALAQSATPSQINIANLCEEHLGPDWQENWDENAPLQKLVNNLNSLKQDNPHNVVEAIENLDEQAARLHFRPMAYLAATTLTAELPNLETHTRSAGIAWTLGKNGPKNFNEVLARIGIETEAQLEKAITKPLSHGYNTTPHLTAQTSNNNMQSSL